MEGAARRIVLDRTFVDDQGARWIVDYKTGTHEGADVEGFLDRERLRYTGQLELYAQALGGTAQLGLYFPLLNGWREWKSRKRQGIERGRSKRGLHPLLHIQMSQGSLFRLRRKRRALTSAPVALRCGCFVPDLTRFTAPQCEGARRVG